MTDEATPLDPIYAVSTYTRTHGVAKIKQVRHDNIAFNKWRASLPGRCWNCPRFDTCTPGNRCNYNPTCKLVKTRK